jgi:hypothetical protein
VTCDDRAVIGEVVDHYRIVAPVGAGSMGEVYRAVDERLSREVAIKLLPQSDEAVAEREVRFLREAKAAGNLNHPGIVTIHDVGRWRQRSYIVMELVDGRRLTEVAARVTLALALSIGRQAAEALAAAHDRGILHRDIKPDNLMLTADGRLKVLDFGVAKLYWNPRGADDDVWGVVTQPGGRGPLGPDLTRTGAVLGTPSYMSPEQAAGRDYDARSDIYSLAIVVYELSTGVRPLVRETLEATLAAAIAGDVPPPSRAAPGRHLPRSLDRVLGRALAPRQEDRYPDMRAFAAAIQEVERELAPVKRRVLLPVGVAVIGIAGLVAGGIAVVRGRADGDEERSVMSVDQLRRLTFDRGCEEMPGLWPDGRAVVFDGIVDGDTELFRLDLESGERTQLTRRPGWDIAGAVSPDGRWIAFVSYGERGRVLMVMEWREGGPGEARAIGISRGFPTWSSAGEIVYSDDRGRIFAIAPTAGAHERQLADVGGGGMVITQAHQVSSGILYGARSAISDSLLRVGVVGEDGRARELAGPIAVDSLGVAIDSERTGFYFGRVTATGFQVRWRSIEGDESEDLAGLPFPYGGLAVAASGDRMVLSTCRQVTQVGRVEGGVFHPIEARREWNDSGLQPLGGGRYAVSSDRSGSNQIWILEPDQEPRVLVTQPSVHATASADGKFLAWTGMSDGPHGIHITEIATGRSRRLTEVDGDDRARFSARGDRVFFLRGGAEGVRIHEVPFAGGAARPVSEPDVIGFDVSPVDDRLLWLARGAQGRTLMIGPAGGPSAVVPGVPVADYNTPRFAGDARVAWLVRGGNELIEVTLDGSASIRSVWSSSNEAIEDVRADPDGAGWLAELAVYEGDLHLAEGRFR